MKNEVIFIGNPDDFLPKTKIVNGEPMLEYQKRYYHSFVNETGGTTTEISLKPFEHEKESYPR